MLTGNRQLPGLGDNPLPSRTVLGIPPYEPVEGVSGSANKLRITSPARTTGYRSPQMRSNPKHTFGIQHRRWACYEWISSCIRNLGP
jgi:hypothetical protein